LPSSITAPSNVLPQRLLNGTSDACHDAQAACSGDYFLKKEVSYASACCIGDDGGEEREKERRGRDRERIAHHTQWLFAVCSVLIGEA
jgi:hypothetical protein